LRRVIALYPSSGFAISPLSRSPTPEIDQKPHLIAVRELNNNEMPVNSTREDK
jgi:hypothetical protein